MFYFGSGVRSGYNATRSSLTRHVGVAVRSNPMLQSRSFVTYVRNSDSIKSQAMYEVARTIERLYKIKYLSQKNLMAMSSAEKIKLMLSEPTIIIAEQSDINKMNIVKNLGNSGIVPVEHGAVRLLRTEITGDGEYVIDKNGHKIRTNLLDGNFHPNNISGDFTVSVEDQLLAQAQQHAQQPPSRIFVDVIPDLVLCYCNGKDGAEAVSKHYDDLNVTGFDATVKMDPDFGTIALGKVVKSNGHDVFQAFNPNNVDKAIMTYREGKLVPGVNNLFAVINQTGGPAKPPTP